MEARESTPMHLVTNEIECIKWLDAAFKTWLLYSCVQMLLYLEMKTHADHLYCHRTQGGVGRAAYCCPS
jgi:hypothetical protein